MVHQCYEHGQVKQCEAGCEAAAVAAASSVESSTKQQQQHSIVVAKLLESVAKEVFYKGLCV